MKPYFVKYLPINGEIKTGDVIVCPDGSTNPVIGFDTDLKHFFTWISGCKCLIDGSDYQKVKLLLCSRDIRKGDKIRCYLPDMSDFTTVEFIQEINGMVEGNFITAFQCIYQDSEIGGATSENFYKVIGEISPKALWVKERDEFSEEDIYRTETERYYDPESEEVEYYTNQILGSAPIKTEKEFSYNPIKILGSCGYFH